MQTNANKSVELSGKQVRAALLVADDELTDIDIARNCGIHVVTLERWKLLPAFQARVHEHIQALSEHLERYAIARKDKRVAAINDRWCKAHEVIEARAVAVDGPGGHTGIVAHELSMARDGSPIDNYPVDTGLLAEMRAMEKQAAQEVGQWTEKRETALSGDIEVTIAFDRTRRGSDDAL